MKWKIKTSNRTCTMYNVHTCIYIIHAVGTYFSLHLVSDISTEWFYWKNDGNNTCITQFYINKNVGAREPAVAIGDNTIFCQLNEQKWNRCLMCHTLTLAIASVWGVCSTCVKWTIAHAPSLTNTCSHCAYHYLEYILSLFDGKIRIFVYSHVGIFSIFG